MSKWIKTSELLPEEMNDSDTQVIVAVKRADSGKTFVFAASYLFQKELYSEEDGADDDGRIYVTGWYELRDDPEYDTAWHPILSGADEVTHWMPLPPPPQSGA